MIIIIIIVIIIIVIITVTVMKMWSYPRGSVFGKLLFFIYINDLLQALINVT